LKINLTERILSSKTTSKLALFWCS